LPVKSVRQDRQPASALSAEGCILALLVARPLAWLRAFCIESLAQRLAGCSLRRSARADASSGPSRGEAAARCGSLSEPQIQHSIFKIKGDCRACVGIYFSSGCSLRRSHVRQRTAGLRRPRLRPADPCGIDFACDKATMRHSQKQALRPGAAAGCRRQRHRICSKSSPATPGGCGLPVAV